MPAIIDGPPGPNEPSRPLLKRLAWFFVIAAGSGLAAALVAYGLDALLPR